MVHNCRCAHHIKGVIVERERGPSSFDNRPLRDSCLNGLIDQLGHGFDAAYPDARANVSQMHDCPPCTGANIQHTLVVEAAHKGRNVGQRNLMLVAIINVRRVVLRRVPCIKIPLNLLGRALVIASRSHAPDYTHGGG